MSVRSGGPEAQRKPVVIILLTDTTLLRCLNADTAQVNHRPPAWLTSCSAHTVLFNVCLQTRPIVFADVDFANRSTCLDRSVKINRP